MTNTAESSMNERKSSSDALEILDAIDRERGESFIGMIQANQVQRLRDEIVALRAERDKLTWEIIDHAPERDELAALREMVERQRLVNAAAIRALKDNRS